MITRTSTVLVQSIYVVLVVHTTRRICPKHGGALPDVRDERGGAWDLAEREAAETISINSKSVNEY